MNNSVSEFMFAGAPAGSEWMSANDDAWSRSHGHGDARAATHHDIYGSTN